MTDKDDFVQALDQRLREALDRQAARRRAMASEGCLHQIAVLNRNGNPVCSICGKNVGVGA